MLRQVPFIGREEELAQIKKLLEEWGTRRALCLHGLGGIGKTRLLQEVHKLFSESPTLYRRVQKKTISVAIVSEMASPEWGKQFIAGIQKMALELGVKLIQTDAHYDLNQMESDLADVVEQQPDAIIINLGNQANLQGYIKKAIEKGIRVLTLYNILEGIEGISVRVTQDDLGGANVSLEKLAENINFQGKIAAISAAGYEPLEKRRSVLDAILQKYPDIKLCVEYGEISDKIVEDTYQKTLAILDEHPDLKAIWATWDEFAKGAVRAIREKKRQDVSVYSFDFGQASFKEMIQPESPWMATVATNPSEIGRIMLRLAVQTVLRIESRGYYTLPMTLITKDSLPKNMNPNSFDWSWFPFLYESDIGWTPQLKAIQAEVSLGEKPKELLVADIIDFDDRTLHLPRNVERQIAHQLAQSAFESYLHGLQDLLKMEAAGVSSQALQQQVERIRKIFVNNLNQVSSNKRLVLLFDTAEKLENEEVWNDLSKLMFASKNALFVLTGRPYKDWWRSLQTKLGADMRLIELEPLKEESSQQYLKQKQRLLHVNLEQKLESKLLFLAGGRPILLDLAIEWISRHLPLDWMTTYSLEELRSLSDEEIAKYKEQFEIQLVSKIIEIRRPMDQLTLVMSRIYPITRVMLVKLLRIPENEAQQLFNEAQSYVFVKSLPDGRISLHDEMRRMINEYVWAEVDPLGIRRRRDSRLAAKLFSEQDKRLKDRLVEREVGDLGHLFEDAVLAREREIINQQWIEHALYSDTESGFDVWKRIVNQRRGENEFSFAKSLVDLASPYYDKFTLNQQFEFDLLKARLTNDTGQVRKAEEMLNELLKKNRNESEREAELYNALGLVEEKLGKLSEALANQLKSLELFEKINPEVVPLVANRVGYIYRQLGKLQEAEKYYKSALKSALAVEGERRYKHLIASLLNNLGYVYGLQNNHYQMEYYNNQAVKMWLKMGADKELSRADAARAILYRTLGKLEESLELLERAISRYKEPDDHELLSKAYFELGWGQLIKAEKVHEEILDIRHLKWDEFFLRSSLVSLIKSKELAERYGLEADLPRILHMIATVYWYLGNLKQDKFKINEARRLNSIAYEKSQKIGDIDYVIDSLLGDAEWDYENEEYNNIPEYNQQLEKYPTEGYDLYFGRMRRIEGDINFASQRFKVALSKYAEAMIMINKHRGYGRYSIKNELLRLGNKMQNSLPPEEIEKWIEYLRQKWVKIDNQNIDNQNIDNQNIDLLMTWCDQQILRAEIASIEW